MRPFGLVKVLCTLLLVDSTVAEPIPIDVKAKLSATTRIVKRVGDGLFGQDGNAATYWAWARVAYDKEWNSDHNLRKLEHKKGPNNEDRKWALLANHDIKIQATLGEPMYDAGLFGSTIETSMNAVVAVDHTSKDIVVAFKGTDDLTTAMQDLKYHHLELPNVQGKVEKGFAECFRSVEGTVSKWLTEHLGSWEQETYSVVFTGHSLGGATAHIAAAYYMKRFPGIANRAYVFTYGAPRVGDREFQQSLVDNYGDRRMFNFRHQHDPVPLVPFIHMGYANPGARWVFTPQSTEDSWFDEKNWEAHPQSDTEKSGWRDSMDMVSKMWNFAYHTGYFQDDKVKVKRDASEDRAASHKHQKRQLTDQELRRAWDLTDEIANSGLLDEPPKYPPQTIEALAGLLRIGDVQKLWNGISVEAHTKLEREAYLRLTIAVVAEQE